MNKEVDSYLKAGKQTIITPAIKKIANSFQLNGIDLVFEILKWIHKNMKANSDKDLKNKIFRTRTADQIIQDGFATGCTDVALVFIALARAKDLPTKYVEAIRRKWLDIGDENNIEGHIFAECFIDNKWYIIDPDQANIKEWYDRWIIYQRGLDSWDIGIKSFDDLKMQFLKFKKEYTINKEN